MTTMIAPNAGQKTKTKRNYVEDHARRTLRKAGLTPEQAANVVKAIKAAPGHKELKLSELSRKIPQAVFHGKVANVIGDAFWWVDAEVKLGLKSGYFSELYGQHSKEL